MSSQKKRRSIVVEGVTYTWKVYPHFACVWHPTEGRREFHRYRDDDGYPTDAITPRRVASFIYRAFLGRSPPPHPEVAVPPPVLHKVLIPKPAAQPEVYLLSREDYEWQRYDGYAERVQRRATTPVAVFTDPAMAKVQAARLNPRNADMLFKLVDGSSVEGQQMGERDFTLYRAAAVSMFETTTVLSQFAV